MRLTNKTFGNSYTIGNGDNSSFKYIYFNIGNTNNPNFRWNYSTNKLQFSNDGINWSDLGSGGGGGGDKILGKWYPGDLDYFETNFGRLNLIQGTNVSQLKQSLLDDTTQQYNNGQFYCPMDLVDTETIYCETLVMATVPTSGKNIAMQLDINSVGDGDSFDVAYNTFTSGDIAMPNSANLVLVSISDTATNMGLVAGKMGQFKHSRIQASIDQLPNDLAIIQLILRRG